MAFVASLALTVCLSAMPPQEPTDPASSPGTTQSEPSGQTSQPSTAAPESGTSSEMPATASPLPLMGLLGLASLGAGIVAHRVSKRLNKS